MSRIPSRHAIPNPPPAVLPDESSARDRELERFEATVLPHLTDAYTLARHLVGDDHDAQDVVQEAALRALRHFAGFRGGAGDGARPWLLAIVRHCALDTLRRRAGRATVEYDDEDHGAALERYEPADRAAGASDEWRHVARAVAALPLEYRETIVLREVQELSYREIATITGVPVGTVMSRLARARERLQRLLGPDRGEA